MKLANEQCDYVTSQIDMPPLFTGVSNFNKPNCSKSQTYTHTYAQARSHALAHIYIYDINKTIDNE